MNQNLTERLQRLGLGKGESFLKLPEQKRTASKVENLVPGQLLSAGERTCFVSEHHYPLDHRHGKGALGALLDQSPSVAALFTRDSSLSSLSFRDLIFIDTETTGLSTGAGTIAFLVGIGYFEDDGFTIRQYFLRTPGDELAMLINLTEQMSRRPGLVSFNGRAFDLPLLENRYILNRWPPPFINSPHLDLLFPARRLWSGSLESCRLIALETEVLGVQRDQADIPSGMIPLIYRDYLLTGNGIEMPRIFYHNRIDVLSMVGLAETLCRAFERPEAALQRGQEWFDLGRWYESLGLVEKAEPAYRRALALDLSPKSFESLLIRLGRLLKRADRRSEAAVVWRQLASVEMDDVRGHVELAMHHEWHTGELERAAHWTRRALELADRWDRERHLRKRPELQHRLSRLERKLARH